MQNSQNKKKLQIVLLVLVAVLTLGIGYASITAVNLIINGNGTATSSQENFKVYFTNGTITEGKGTVSIDDDDPTIGYFDVIGLSRVGDKAVVEYTVLNDSNGIGVELLPSILTSSNQEYFKVSEEISTPQEEKNKLQAGESTTIKVTIDVIKTPMNEEVSTSISIKINAIPIENEDAAVGGEYKEVSLPTAFASDSWTTIKTNVQSGNTSQYNIGDTKTVTVNGKDYTVRIANKSTYDWCEDESYSQTACGFVVEFVDIITPMTMRDTSTNEGGYPATLVYDYLKNTLYGQLPSDLQAAIKPTRVLSGSNVRGNYYTSLDYLYLLSEKELVNKSNYDAVNNTFQLDYYRDNYNDSSDLIKKYQEIDTKWWLRAAVLNDNYSFRIVSARGGLSIDNNDNSVGVSPAFRIG